MSQYGTEFHKWLNGDFRTDGVQSDWLKEQLRRRAEEMGRRQFVKAKQIKLPQTARAYSDPEHRKEIVRKSMTKLRARLLKEGICRDCQKNKVKEGRSSCQLCLTGRYERQKTRRHQLKQAA